jgi:hypothetical protein
MLKACDSFAFTSRTLKYGPKLYFPDDRNLLNVNIPVRGFIMNEG